jgi:hypothetical protein
MGHAMCKPTQRVRSLDVLRAGSEGLKGQSPRSCPEWLLDSHGAREMLNEGNVPSWDKNHGNFLYAIDWNMLRASYTPRFLHRSSILLFFFFIRCMFSTKGLPNSVGNFK